MLIFWLFYKIIDFSEIVKNGMSRTVNNVIKTVISEGIAFLKTIWPWMELTRPYGLLGKLVISALFYKRSWKSSKTVILTKINLLEYSGVCVKSDKSVFYDNTVFIDKNRDYWQKTREWTVGQLVGLGMKTVILVILAVLPAE